jgi:hypothetical protein
MQIHNKEFVMLEKCAQLYAILTSLVRCHEQLVETAQKMNSALREQNVPRVKSIAIAYDEIACQIEELEENRLEVCDAMTLPSNTPARHANLSIIISFVPDKEKKLFIDIQKRLKTTIGKFAQINESNQVLLSESLHVFDKTMDIFTRNTSGLPGYGAPGHKESEPMRRQLINQIA